MVIPTPTRKILRGPPQRRRMVYLSVLRLLLTYVLKNFFLTLVLNFRMCFQRGARRVEPLAEREIALTTPPGNDTFSSNSRARHTTALTTNIKKS